MNVIFTTNIDAYNGFVDLFPKNMEMPPRVGEMVCVKDSLFDHFQKQKLPIRLEVVRVIWKEYNVCCELWYNKTDMETAVLAGAKTL